jgi:hypothetical protein
MPIRRYVKKEVVFTPRALSPMSKALEAATEALAIGSDDAKRRAVAEFIIGLAQKDDSLDATTLRDKALAALGGVAYCAPPGIPQSSNPRASADLAAKRWILHDGEAGAL